MDAKITAIEAANLLGVTVQSIHKHLKIKKLLFHKNQNRIFFGYETAKELFKLNFKKKTIAIQIVKGGTGKTSIVHALAIRANLYGARVLCIDLDQQGNLSQAFKINPEDKPVMVDVLRENLDIRNAIIPISNGLDVIASRIENAVLDNIIVIDRHPLDRVYKDRIDSIKKNYDLILIDCPPALGQSVAAATLASDIVISPVTPEKFCLSGLKITSQELNNIERNYHKEIPMKIALNKFDSRTSLSHEVLSTLIKHPAYGEKLYKSYIRISQEFPNVIANGTSIFDTLKTNSAKEDIDLLTREILEIKQLSREQIEISLGSLEEKDKNNI